MTTRTGHQCISVSNVYKLFSHGATIDSLFQHCLLTKHLLKGYDLETLFMIIITLPTTLNKKSTLMIYIFLSDVDLFIYGTFDSCLISIRDRISHARYV